MSIEKLLQDLIVALDNNTKALAKSGGTVVNNTSAKAPTAAEKKKAAAAKKAEAAAADPLDDDGPTREDVKKVLRDYAQLESKAAAIQILKDNGAASIGELETDKFQAVIDATS